MFWPSLQIYDLSVSGLDFGSLAASCAYIYNPHDLYNSPFFLLVYLRMRVKKTGTPTEQDNTRVKKPLDPSITRLLGAKRERSPYPSVGGRNGGAQSVREIPSNNDPLWENILEAVPFYGSFLSWDDAEEAYKKMRQRGAYIPNFNEGVDMLSAIPFGNTASKAPAAANALIEIARQSPKYLKMLENMLSVYDSAQDISEDNLK